LWVVVNKTAEIHSDGHLLGWVGSMAITTVHAITVSRVQPIISAALRSVIK